MDKLKEYIKQHKSFFYQKEVPEEHEKRFLAKLQKGKKKNVPEVRFRSLTSSPDDRMRLWRKRLFKVAVAVFLFIGSVGLFKMLNRDNDRQLARLAAEIAEVENFYMVKCEKELTHFRTYYGSNSPIDIAKELEELEEEYKKLKEEMIKEPGNKRIMAALVENLQLRLQLLEQINRLMEKEEPQITDI